MAFAGFENRKKNQNRKITSIPQQLQVGLPLIFLLPWLKLNERLFVNVLKPGSTQQKQGSKGITRQLQLLTEPRKNS